MELRTLSLFSGIGGFEVAARRVGGFRVRKFVEIDPDAQLILRHHFPGIDLHSDIRTGASHFCKCILEGNGGIELKGMR